MIYPREILKEIRKYIDSKEAIIITGMRRTGKTTLLKIIFEEVSSKNKIFLDLENPLNRKYFEQENYENIKKTFEFLGINFNKKSFIFLDEIQFVKNLPSVVKYFIDHYNVKFFLTGSASFYLKNLFSESLAGRKFIFELFPLSFREFIIFKELNLNIPERVEDFTQSVFETLLPFYEEYLYFGGFPEVVLKESVDEKEKSLEEIFKSYFQMEVVTLGDFRKNEIIRDLILLLMQRTGSRLDLSKISIELGVSRNTIKEYISFLEGTYFIHLLRPFSKKINTEIRKMPKVYFCDTGILNKFARVDKGVIFENAVFLALRRKGEVNYYGKKSGVEIDFIFNKDTAYEVKIKPEKGDLKKLRSLCNSLKINKYFIVSKNYVPLSKIIHPILLEKW